MSEVRIRAVQSTDRSLWDTYVQAHPQATLYHLYGWRNVIERTYGHETYYLAATKDISAAPMTRHPTPNAKSMASKTQNPKPKTRSLGSNSQLVGVLPLVHLKSLIFGNSLISMPYVDLGGILADDAEIERALLNHAIKLGQNLRAGTIELRHEQPLSCLNATKSIDLINQMNSKDSTNPKNPINSLPVVTRSHKARMLLDLPRRSDTLMQSFKSKLRSQIKKPIKEGLVANVGGDELLMDFYAVFSSNMRDLGSPVHSHKLMKHVLEEFSNHGRIVVVYRDKRPLACGLIIGFDEIIGNPWASALREFSSLSPNMLLYWTMLAYASERGYKRFDFGRSSPGGGTYKFKEQWGAKPTALHWHYISLNGRPTNEETSGESRFGFFIGCWQRLPVFVTRFIGPMIRKHIGL